MSVPGANCSDPRLKIASKCSSRDGWRALSTSMASPRPLVCVIRWRKVTSLRSNPCSEAGRPAGSLPKAGRIELTRVSRVKLPRPSIPPARSMSCTTASTVNGFVTDATSQIESMRTTLLGSNPPSPGVGADFPSAADQSTRPALPTAMHKPWQRPSFTRDEANSPTARKASQSSATGDAIEQTPGSVDDRQPLLLRRLQADAHRCTRRAPIRRREGAVSLSGKFIRSESLLFVGSCVAGGLRRVEPRSRPRRSH